MNDDISRRHAVHTQIQLRITADEMRRLKASNRGSSIWIGWKNTAALFCETFDGDDGFEKQLQWREELLPHEFLNENEVALTIVSIRILDIVLSQDNIGDFWDTGNGSELIPKRTHPYIIDSLEWAGFVVQQYNDTVNLRVQREMLRINWSDGKNENENKILSFVN